MTTKPTNPKDIIGSAKLDTGLVPDTLPLYAALAFTEGALKYGRFNWRVAGVRASVYNAALRRHLTRWWNGEDCDPKTGVPHLASILACAGILLDAKACGKLTDDRPPALLALGQLLEDMQPLLAQLRDQFREHNPHQYTIADMHDHAPGEVLDLRKR